MIYSIFFLFSKYYISYELHHKDITGMLLSHDAQQSFTVHQCLIILTI